MRRTKMAWNKLPEDIIEHIYKFVRQTTPPHPFAEEIKTLALLDDVLRVYDIDFLIIDLCDFAPNEKDTHWGVHRKWKSMTPEQRRSFYELKCATHG